MRYGMGRTFLILEKSRLSVVHKVLDKNGVPRYATTVIPNRGAWLEYEQDINDIQWVHVDRTRKIGIA